MEAPTDIPRVLIIVNDDPRLSAKPAEAVRVAAGVGAWERVEITLYLRGAAVRALTPCPEGLVDEDNFSRYLPVLAKQGRPVLVQHGAPAEFQLDQPAIPCREISDEELATEVGRSRMVLRF